MDFVLELSGDAAPSQGSQFFSFVSAFICVIRGKDDRGSNPTPGVCRGFPSAAPPQPKAGAQPLDGFDRLTAGRLGALTHSTPLRIILSLSNG